MFDVITIGSATQDIFLKGVNFLSVRGKCFLTEQGICLPLGAKLRARESYFFSGGGATNTAVSFSRFGLKTGIICRIGRDSIGELIIQELQAENVDCSLIQYDYVKPTAVSIIFLTKGGERTIVSYKGAGERISLGEISRDKLKTKWLFLGSLGKERNILKNIIQWAKEKKIHLAINPGWLEMEWLKKHPDWLRYFDIFIVNQEEAAYFTGIPYNKSKKLFQKLDDLVQGIVVMTRGKRGVIVSDGRFLWRAGVFPQIRPRDLTGAGDAFASAFTAVIIKQGNQEAKTIKKAIRVGSLNASSVIRYIGTKPGILYFSDYRQNILSKLKIIRSPLYT